MRYQMTASTLMGTLSRGDAFLLLNICGDRPQVKFDQPFDKRPDEVQTRSCRTVELAKSKNNAPLVLIGDPQAQEGKKNRRDADQDQ
jgi:hypothetical protein